MGQRILYASSIILFYILLYSCEAYVSIVKKEPVTKVKYPRKIEYGDTLVISWNIEKADSIVLDGYERHLSPEGSISFIPDTTVNYVLFVYRKNETKRKRINVEVKRPDAAYISLPDSVNDEQTFSLKYRFENVSHIKVVTHADSLSPSGEYKMRLDTTSLITLIGYGKHDSVVIQQPVKVGYVEETNCPGSIYRGQNAKIYWKFKNCKEVRIEGFKKAFASVDSINVSPDNSREYKIYACRNDGNIDTIKHQLVVKSPYIKSFSAPNFVKKGELFTIKWETAGAGFALLDGDTVPPCGSKSFRIAGSTLYTLTIFSGKTPVMNTIKVHDLPQRAFVINVDPNFSLKPGQRVDVDIIAVEQSRYPKEIKLHVVIVDSSGNYISNLAPPYSDLQNVKKYFGSLVEKTGGKTYPQDFKVREIRHDTSRYYDISLVLDHSGSMWGTIDILQEASKVFIENKYPKDRVSVIKFDHNVETMTHLEMDIDSLIKRSKFNGLEGFGGLTSLYAGTDLGIINLQNATNEKVVILFTDGYENSSFQHFGRLAYNVDQVAQKLRKQRIRLFIISFGECIDKELLSKLAVLSGGKHYNILREKDLVDVFKELPRVFRHYYEISFIPKPGEGEHHLRLTYKNQVGDLLYVETDYFVGDDWSLDKLDQFSDTTYNKLLPPGKKVVVSSQTVATFDFDKDTLKMKYYPAINNYVEYLKNNPKAEALIIGHTDSKGSAEYCYDLSKRRAKAVREYLVDKGVDKNKLKIKGFGKDKLIWKDDTEDWKGWENRRVEVLIFE